MTRLAGRLPQRRIAGALFAATVAVSVIGVPAATATARIFFLVALVPAIVVLSGVLASWAPVAAAAVFLALGLAQRTMDRPVAEPPSSQWTAALATPDQAVRHTIALPLESEQWAQWWWRASGVAVYMCARGPLSAQDGLELRLNTMLLGTVTQDHAIGPRPQPTSVGFYRVPVERSVLERDGRATFELRRARDATARPIDVCGTFTYRPTAGLDASAFFDGRTWTNIGREKQGRFIIEVRIESEPGHPIAALY